MRFKLEIALGENSFDGIDQIVGTLQDIAENMEHYQYVITEPVERNIVFNGRTIGRWALVADDPETGYPTLRSLSGGWSP